MTLLRVWLIGLVIATPAFGQDEDEEQRPGLRAQFRVHDAMVERIDHGIAFAWDDAAPDERLPSGPFSASWTGSLLFRSEGKYRFHAFLQGSVKLSLNGQQVLQGQSDQPGWISGPETAMKFGDHPLQLTYSRTAQAGQLKLYWSSNEFPLEPVPYHALFQSQPSADLTLIERGRIQFDTYRCGNCHSAPGPSDNHGQLAAPSLAHVGVGTNTDWLVSKLMQGADEKAAISTPTRMPHFGFSKEDAATIVATLQAKAAAVDLIPLAKTNDAEHAKDLQAGKTLIRSVGCLACHTWNSLGETTDYGGGSLDLMSERRSPEWLNTWLASPARLNARHRMPLVTLTEKERARIVWALGKGTPANATPAASPKGDLDDQRLARGLKLIESANCSSCHEIPSLKLEARTNKPLIVARMDWDRGCTAPPDRSLNRPSFPQADRQALHAYVASWKVADVTRATSARSPTSDLMGQRWLQRKNCLSCHDRDDISGLSKHAAAIARSDDGLAGLHMTLIPPRLNSVGDRMHDPGLAEAIRGDQEKPRLDWLRVRMPKFSHSPTEQAALQNHLIGHDRIPDGGPVPEWIAAANVQRKPDGQRILAGRELLGGKGFSCVACHAVKEYTPKVAALGTRGSNLHRIGDRMRTSYFFRWTQAPLRVMPGVEMPNYQRPHEFILPGHLDQQMVAIWDALNDPNLTAPTNHAVVEQLLTAGEHDNPRVVRDVFTIPGSADETVARAYAIGLPGGHAVLFDLETCGVRAWTLGDFARQRCEGKRWYWDLAGTVMATKFDKRPDILLLHEPSREVIAPETGWDVECRLISSSFDQGAATTTYGLQFSRNGETHTLPTVVERWSALTTSGATGWERRIQIPMDDATKVWPWFRNASPEVIHERSKISADGTKDTPIASLPKTAVRFSPAAENSHRAADLVVRYATSLSWPNTMLKPAPELISRPDSISSVPGFQGQRLPLPRSIMPTAMTWDSQDRLVFTSLKGHLFRLQSTGGGQSSLVTIAEGLAAPFGVIEHQFSDPAGTTRDLVVAHKPELLRLTLDQTGQSRKQSVLATGWGVTDDYHDWTCGIVRDSCGKLIVGLGSDYTFKNRPIGKSKWRGDILRIDNQGTVESIARGLRYPTGLAIDDQDRLFCSDQQGVQNTFNELNYIQVGHRYGVPSRHEPQPDAPADRPAVQIPHPWTRSVNGIVWIPKSQPDHSGKPAIDHVAAAQFSKLAPIAGHFLGCEMNNNMLIRMTVQTVGTDVQGAVYPFSRPAKEGDPSNFLGPLCIGISPQGELFVGGLQDGGWAGGLNTGDIVKLTPNGNLPNGIREIRATARGFDIEFFDKVDPKLATETSRYKISGYTRIWKGDYATPDSGHHSGEVLSAQISPDLRMVSLVVSGRKAAHVYDVSIGDIGDESQRSLWPSIGHYTLNRIPD